VTRVLLFAVLIFLVARAFWSVIDGVIEAAGGAPKKRRKRRETVPAVKLARDPVCGTHVPTNAALSLTTGSETHYFCSEECRQKFRHV
jgi:YHS domain-containing protein